MPLPSLTTPTTPPENKNATTTTTTKRSRIPDADSRALGFDPRFTRPDWLLITALPVPPPPVRPSVLMDSSARCEDDLTHKLIEIVRANAALRRQTLNGAPQ